MKYPGVKIIEDVEGVTDNYKILYLVIGDNTSPGDEISVIDLSGMTEKQRDAFNFLSKLLHWRKGSANEIIAKGQLKHFMPRNGQYIYERRLGDRAIQIIMNGTDEPQKLIAERISEILPIETTQQDVLTERKITITPDLVLEPREILILEDL